MSGSISTFLERNPEVNKSRFVQQVRECVFTYAYQQGWSETDEPVRQAVLRALERYEEIKKANTVRSPHGLLMILLHEQGLNIPSAPEPDPVDPELFS